MYFRHHIANVADNERKDPTGFGLKRRQLLSDFVADIGFSG
jgi:hypothetical protein